MSNPSSIPGVVFVLYGGLPVDPADTQISAVAESLQREIEKAIAPHAEKIRALGGTILADIPMGKDAADIEVRDLPPDFTAELLALI